MESDYDDCLFTNGDIVILFWTNDYMFYSKHKGVIDKLNIDLKEEFLLEKRKIWQGFWDYR